ncbi:MAG: PmoA family protein [Gemmataceae bacterium]
MRATGGFIALLLLALPARAEDAAPAVRLKPTDAGVEFYAGDHLVTRLHTSEKLAKPVFWPLDPIPKLSVTRAWPMEDIGDEKKDHVHHRSLWFCHGDVIPEGMEFVKSGDKRVHGVDFWSEGKNHGKIVCVGVEVKGDKAVMKNEWREPGGKKVLDETRTITLAALGKDRNLLVFDIDLLAGDYPLTFGDTKEGSLGVRVRKTVALETGKGGQMTDDRGGSGEKQVWGKVANWCDYSGPLGEAGPVGGVAIFADPKNPTDTAWHSRGYGLMAANPFGRAASFPGRKGNTTLVKLAKGEHLTLRFGVYLHAGDANDGKVAEAYKVFAK